MTKSPVQVFSEQRTDQLGMAALNKLTSGGSMGGGTTMINTGSNIQKNSTTRVTNTISNTDPIIDSPVTSSFAI